MPSIHDDAPSGRFTRWLTQRVNSRPTALHLLVFSAAYVLAGGFGQGLAIIPGVSITFWPPAGVFVATLLLNPRSQWPWYVGAGCLAELICNAFWFHNALPLAVVYFGANALEALTAAWLIHRLTPKPFRLESLEEVAAFVVAGAGLAPIVGATVIAATDQWLGKHSFATAWPLVWLGDGTGLLVSTPLTFVAVQAWRERARIAPRRLAEAGTIGLALLGVCAWSFQGYLPTAYLAMPLLLWAAVRFQLKGAAMALGFVTVLTAAFTVNRTGQLVGSPERMHETVVTLQTFLGISAVSALLVGALSWQHRQALFHLKSINAVLEARVAERTASLTQSEDRFRRATRAVSGVIWEWDMRTGHVYRSEGLYDLIGVRPEEVPPTRTWWLERIHPDDRARLMVGADKLLAEAVQFAGDYRLRHEDGRWIDVWERGLIEREPGGNAVRLVGFTADITDRKRAEELLREADRHKDEFLAMLAHELRNPLAPMRNAVQVLTIKASGEPDLQWAGEVLDRQVHAMSRLVDDLMDVSRVNQGKVILQRSQVELSQVLRGAIETSRPLIEQMEHKLLVSLPSHPIRIDGDLTRLTQVFINLLNNAAKYMERGGRIDVRAEYRDEEVAVSVRDMGIGIAPAKLPTIFDMFAQVPGSLERAQGGLGIGLCLAQRLIELHGGRIEAHSDGVGHGSEFVVRLPAVAQPPSDESPSPREPVSRVSNLRVLVVDDNHDSAESAAMLLRMTGNDVRLAHDGEAALAVAEQFRPQVVLCDIGLPRRNGYDVCRHIRQQPWGADMVLVAVTGWGQDGDRQNSSDAGFDHHLVKPVDPQALLKLLTAVDRVHRVETP
ncbi:MAG: MASE1 domain-containing protein [Pirellulaceae bacterium]